MRNLITVTLPYICSPYPIISSAAQNTSYLRLCDGPSNITVSGDIFFANLLTSIKSYKHTVDLLGKSGGCENFEPNLSFDFIDGNILEILESFGYSLNNGTVFLQQLEEDNINISPLFFGYIDSCSISNNILTITTSTIGKALGQINDITAYGYNTKLPLNIDTTLSQKQYQFAALNGNLSYHPRLLQTFSTQNPNDTNFGVIRTNITSGAVSIIVGHCNDVFANAYATYGTPVRRMDGSIYYIAAKNLQLSFVGTSTNPNAYRIASITRIQDKTGSLPEYQTKLTFLENVFTSIDIRSFDRVSITEATSYYLINPSINLSNIKNIFTEDNSLFYSLNSGSWGIETIAGKTYIAVYSKSLFYSEVPITLDLSYHQWSTDGNYNSSAMTPFSYVVSGNTYYTSLDPALCLDNDMSSYVGIYNYTDYHVNGGNYILYNDLYFNMTPDLSNYIGKPLFFGALIDRPSFDANRISYLINTYLDSGEVFPCNTAGLVDYTTPFLTYAAIGGVGIPGFLNSAPIGDISIPANYVGSTSPNSTVIYNTNPLLAPGVVFLESSVNSNLFFTFDPSKLISIPIDTSIYPDLDHITFLLRGGIANGGALAHSDGNGTFVYRVGIWAQVTLDSPATIYVETSGTSGLSSGKPDSVIRDILHGQGLTTTNNFDNYSNTGLSAIYFTDATTEYHFATTQKDRQADEIQLLCQESSIVVGQDCSGIYYSNPINFSKNFTANIPSSAIYDITNSLQDIDKSNLLTLPKIILKSKNNTEESFEILNLDLPFPALSAFLIDNTILNSAIYFTKDFIKYATFYSDLTTLYNQLLSPIWQLCWNSYKKSNLLKTGDIKFDTIYLENVLRPIATTYTSAWNLISTFGDPSWNYLSPPWSFSPAGIPDPYINHGAANLPAPGTPNFTLTNPISIVIGNTYNIHYYSYYDSSGSYTFTVGGFLISSFNPVLSAIVVSGSSTFVATNTSGCKFICTSAFDGEFGYSLSAATISASYTLTNAPQYILNNVIANVQNRKTLTVTLPWSYRNIKLGDRVKLYDPRIFLNNSVFGYCTEIIPEIKTNTVSLTLLCDSWQNGTGDPNFF